MSALSSAPGDDNPQVSARACKRIDLHCHSEASNKTAEVVLNAIACPECYSTPAEVYAQARRRGMDFVTLTDHDTIDGAMALARLQIGAETKTPQDDVRDGTIAFAPPPEYQKRGNSGNGIRDDVLVGEELTCWFPEDECKMHVLVWGIGPAEHEKLQSLARNIYDVAEYIERHQLAHAVAHPIYRQNDKLERWHLERLLLLFKGFECLNGAHSSLHREAFAPLLDRLGAVELERLAAKHDLSARWPQPWVKSRVAGSDDHGLLNIGRTWTEFPSSVRTTADVLRCLREGACNAGGEAGSSIKLAHTFYSVAVRYYTRHILTPAMNEGRAGLEDSEQSAAGAEALPLSAGGGRLGTEASHKPARGPNMATVLLQTIVGERPLPGKARLVTQALAAKVRRAARKICAPILGRPAARSSTGTALLPKLFLDSIRKRLAEHPALRASLEKGLPPLGEHEEMFRFVADINRDVMQGIAAEIGDSVERASFTGLFNAIAAVLAQQFVLAPYYFAAFHQNKERRLLRQIRDVGLDAGLSESAVGDDGGNPPRQSRTGGMRVGLFTDTFDDVNGVSRFLHDLSEHAAAESWRLTIHTCGETGGGKDGDAGNELRKNFEPLLSRPMPLYPSLRLNLPPVLEILEWVDRRQFDAIHISTPGPMGICGFLAARMLRVPLLGTYHTDFPAYMNHLTRDHRAVNAATLYMKWLFGQMSRVFVRSRQYLHTVRDLGIAEDRLLTIQPGVNSERFNPRLRDPQLFTRTLAHLGVRQPRRLLYCGRISVEKNLPMLAESFRLLCRRRDDTALIVAGDGPYLPAMRKATVGLPVHFLGNLNDEQLGPLYASSDLLVFPSRTDTLGQVVLEAQACGLPAIVSDEGGPKETVLGGVSGVILPAATSAAGWCEAIDALLNDEGRLQRMSRAAPLRVAPLSPKQTFEAFWFEHARAAGTRVENREGDLAAPAGARSEEAALAAAPTGSGV